MTTPANHPLEGGCACGAVRYRLTAPPMIVHCCHCRDCQRQRGSAFAVNAVMEADRVERLAGGPMRNTLPTGSGRPLDDYVCRDCGTSVWADYGRRRVMLFVRVGTLVAPGCMLHDLHIFTPSGQRWALDGGARSPRMGVRESAPIGGATDPVTSRTANCASITNQQHTTGDPLLAA
jgi:hypothetical protein